MSPPRQDWAPTSKANFISHRSSASAVKEGEAHRDWMELAQAIHSAGGVIVVVPTPPNETLTGMPYTAEAGHAVVRDGQRTFLLPNLTPPHRQGEAAVFSDFFSALGWKVLKSKARWEGQGDLFRVTESKWLHTYGVGPWARTEASAFEEIKAHFPGEHLQIGFKADPWFHGNTFFGVYYDAPTNSPHCLVCPEALLEGEFERLKDFLGPIPIQQISPEQSRRYATNALQVKDHIIAPPEYSTEVEAFWRNLGLSIIEVPLNTLFGRGGGAGVCLTNRLHGLNAADFPEAVLFSTSLLPYPTGTPLRHD